ncbi:MAG: DUF2442 domain-containing protein [Deltaproteobacteria bacterium]|nr:DUF2442 domain-containing protein [Deltaproteobacteria bacterium]
MKSATRGKRISATEVTNVSKHGFWIFVDGRELFAPFALFPWFEKSSIAEILEVERQGPDHLYWPKLDVDLAIRSLEHPEEFPLVSRVSVRGDRPRPSIAKKRSVGARRKKERSN